MFKTESKDERAQRIYHEETLPRLKAEAAAMVPKILAEQEDRLAKFVADHATDCAGYEFRCERWGDFLALYIKRGEKREKKAFAPRYMPPPNKVVGSCNLGATSIIRLTDGRAPDLGATCKIERDHVRAEGSGEWTYTVRSRYESYRHPGPMIRIDAPPSNANGYGQTMQMGQPDEPLIPVLSGCAQGAEDDQIRFEGAGVGITLHVPYGLGKTIHEAILLAVRDGYEPPASSVLALGTP